MLKFVLRRIGASLLILLGTTVLIYALLLAAPGGPEQKYANNPKYTPQQQQAYVKALGLDTVVDTSGMQPALDLMGRLDPANGARPGHAVYDLGCGAGNITRILAERFPAAKVDAIELYDHQVDPQENTNLARQPAQAELVAQLMTQWRAGWKGAVPAARP